MNIIFTSCCENGENIGWGGLWIKPLLQKGVPQKSSTLSSVLLCGVGLEQCHDPRQRRETCPYNTRPLKVVTLGAFLSAFRETASAPDTWGPLEELLERPAAHRIQVDE